MGPTRRPTRLPDGVHKRPSKNGLFQFHPHSQIKGPTVNLGERDCRPFTEKSPVHRRQELLTQSLLVILLPDDQETGHVVTNHQLKTPQQRLDSSEGVQNGNTGSHPLNTSTRPLGYPNRPEGCLSSHPDPSRSSKVPGCKVQRRGLLLSDRAVWSFDRITRVALAYLRRKGIHILAYLDDWLLLAHSSAEASSIMDSTIALLTHLGLVVNEQQSSLTTSQRVTYLGAVLNFQRGTVTTTPERVQTLVDLASQLAARHRALVRLWLRLLGLMASMVDVIPYCRLFVRPI